MSKRSRLAGAAFTFLFLSLHIFSFSQTQKAVSGKVLAAADQPPIPGVTVASKEVTVGADDLQQVLLQKYLAFFQNSDWEAYYNWRRTGIPAFHTGPGTGPNGVIPKTGNILLQKEPPMKATW